MLHAVRWGGTGRQRNFHYKLVKIKSVKSALMDVDGRIILRWIFRKLEGVVGTGWSWLRIGTGGGHL
jgi:hypothetical protein